MNGLELGAALRDSVARRSRANPGWRRAAAGGSVFVEHFEAVRALEDMWFKSGPCRASWVWLAVLAVGCSDAEGRSDVSVSPQLLRQARFDSVAAVAVEELASNDGSGISIAVMEAGELVWAEGFGSASTVRDSAVGADTTFQIGSTTKQLTAMAVLAQVDRGSYSLDDSVAELLPGFALASDPDWAEQTTLRHLLSHQSGLVDHVQLVGTTEDHGLADFYRSEFAATQWAMNPPGLFWNVRFVTVNGLTLDLTFIVDAEGHPTPWLRTRFFAARRAEDAL